MTPEEIVKNWIDNQLRQEGRDGIYIDDEAALIIDIKQAILEEREDCAKFVFKKYPNLLGAEIAQAIRERGKL